MDEGTFTVAGAVTLGSKAGTGGTGTATGVINLSGGSFTVNSTAGSFVLAANSAATGAAVGTVNVTGGTFTSDVNITRGGGTNTTATVTLDGANATINLLGRSLGTAAQTIGFNARQGTLLNLGEFNGGASLVKTTAGILTLGGANGYSGATNINAGTLKVGSSTAIPTGLGKGDVVLNGGATEAGTLDLNGFDASINGLTGASETVLGRIVNDVSGTKTLTVGNANASATFAGTIADNSGTGGVVAFAKTGSGTQTLSGNNTYTGATSVTGGTLLVTGSIAASNATVSGAATLGGTGTVGAVTVSSGASLRGGLGDAPSGTLTSGGAVTFGDGSLIALSLGTSGAHSSLARAGGSWSFDLDQAFVFSDFGVAVGTYDDLISGLTGSETGLASIASWTIQNEGFVGTFSYDGSGGVDLVLTAIPEPASLASLLGGFATLAILRRARRRR
jgi:autotransporter-associated beta strand protein